MWIGCESYGREQKQKAAPTPSLLHQRSSTIIFSNPNFLEEDIAPNFSDEDRAMLVTEG